LQLPQVTFDGVPNNYLNKYSFQEVKVQKIHLFAKIASHGFHSLAYCVPNEYEHSQIEASLLSIDIQVSPLGQWRKTVLS